MHRSFHQDREQVVERATVNHVTPLIITGTSLRNSIEAARFAGRYSGKLYATAGVHPHDAKNCSEDTIAKLKELRHCRRWWPSENAAWTITGISRRVQRKWFTE